MLKCKLNEKLDCRIAEFFKRELNEQDCFCCFAMVFKGMSDGLISIMSDVGAGVLYREFMVTFTLFTEQTNMFTDLLYRCYPEIEEIIKKRMKDNREVEEVLRKFMDKPNGDGVV